MDGPGEFWQAFEPAPDPGRPQPPRPTRWHDRYAASMRDGSVLTLPLRDYGAVAMAGFIANQASFAVIDRLAGWIADDVAHLGAHLGAHAGAHAGVDVVVGLPTLGHPIAAAVARALGHANWVAPGTTRKLWYDEALSQPLHSVTSPEPGRRLWLDPRLLPRLAGRSVLLVDDVVSTGSSARAGLALLARAGVTPVAFAVAMIQGEAWRRDWNPAIPVHAAFATPLFHRAETGWRTVSDPE